MLNTSIRLGHNTQNVTLNSPSHGILQRSHPKSIFIRFQKGSSMEGMVFPTEGIPYIHKSDTYPYPKREVTVLQVLVFGDDSYLCEVVEDQFLIEENPTQLTNK